LQMKKDKQLSRERIISRTSSINIIVNLMTALTKVIFGFLASSIAIISEGVNNAADALTSLLSLVGTRLAQKKPDDKHPFGYGRIEYLTSLSISLVILYGGLEMLVDAIRRIFEPEELKISYLSLVVVIISAIVKFILGNYTISKGEQTDSSALKAVGIDCRNDSFVSLVTIASALLFLLSHIDLDAYAGIFTSYMILKAGYEVLSDTLSELLGQPADKELATQLYHMIRGTDGVLNAVDMILHNYGPETYTGSVNVEIDHKKTVGEIYDTLRSLQLRILETYHVLIVFGIYAVDNDSKDSKKLRQQIAEYVRSKEHLISFHAVFMDQKRKRIYCDLVVDHEAGDLMLLHEDFVGYLKNLYPDQDIEVNIDTEFI